MEKLTYEEKVKLNGLIYSNSQLNNMIKLTLSKLKLAKTPHERDTLRFEINVLKRKIKENNLKIENLKKEGNNNE